MNDDSIYDDIDDGVYEGAKTRFFKLYEKKYLIHCGVDTNKL